MNFSSAHKNPVQDIFKALTLIVTLLGLVILFSSINWESIFSTLSYMG